MPAQSSREVFFDSFQATFVESFEQLQEQADWAFKVATDLKVLRSIFSSGNLMTAMEWVRPGTRPLDPMWAATRKHVETQINQFKAKEYNDARKKLAKEPNNKPLKDAIIECDKCLLYMARHNPLFRYWGISILDDVSLVKGLNPTFCHALRWTYSMPHLKARVMFEPSYFTPPDAANTPIARIEAVDSQVRLLSITHLANHSLALLLHQEGRRAYEAVETARENRLVQLKEMLYSFVKPSDGDSLRKLPDSGASATSDGSGGFRPNNPPPAGNSKTHHTRTKAKGAAKR